MIFLWSTLAVAAPDWTPIGPERGHVVDFSTSEEGLFSATRVGVMTSEGPGKTWERDSRFPTGTRRIAAASTGVWAAPPGQLWEVSPDDTRLVSLFPGAIAVDLEVQESGQVFAAVRGKNPGVWTASAGGAAKQVLTDIDPWTISTRGKEVWVGSVNEGLWHSETAGQEWEQVLEGSISALGIVGEHLWVGRADGTVFNWDTDTNLIDIPGGHATHIAGLDENEALLIVSSQNAQTGPLQILNANGLQSIRELRVDDDIGLLGPTGAWSLGTGQAMVGSFRRGPLLWDGSQLATDRSGFQAMVSGGAATDAQGRLILGAMGTGVYIWENGVFGAHLAGQGPVTDTVGIKRIGDQVSVIDFEGIVTLDAQGQWSRIEGVQNFDLGRRNGLIDVGSDGEGTLWGLDSDGKLFQRSGESWTPCRLNSATRFDGDGDHLVIATERGYFSPDCQASVAAFDFQATASNSSAIGGWVASPGQLYGGGSKTQRLPSGDIYATALSDQGLLIAIANQSLLLCAPKCAQIGPALPGKVDAIGWLSDGRIWAMEDKGSLLVLEESGSNPGPWSTIVSEHPVDWSQSPLLKNPWMHHATGGQNPPQQGPGTRPPKPDHSPQHPASQAVNATAQTSSSGMTWAFRIGGLLLMAGGGLFFWRQRKR